MGQLEEKNLKLRKTQHTVDEKLYAVKQIIYQNRRRMNAAIELQISFGTLNNWLKRYQLEGVEGLHPKRDNKVNVKSVAI